MFDTPRVRASRLGLSAAPQVDSFLNEERASIDEYDQYLTERSALADRTKAANARSREGADEAVARNRGGDGTA